MISFSLLRFQAALKQPIVWGILKKIVYFIFSELQHGHSDVSNKVGKMFFFSKFHKGHMRIVCFELFIEIDPRTSRRSTSETSIS